MEIQEKKLKLIERLSNVENSEVLDEIEKILNQNDKIDFDFDKAYKQGYTVPEFKKEIFKRIKSYPWKK
jgi:hypothetical protein